jgi:hypothetical protein
MIFTVQFSFCAYLTKLPQGLASRYMFFLISFSIESTFFQQPPIFPLSPHSVGLSLPRHCETGSLPKQSSMTLVSVTTKNENTLTIPCLTRNPGDRVAGFRLSPEWDFCENLNRSLFIFAHKYNSSLESVFQFLFMLIYSEI